MKSQTGFPVIEAQGEYRVVQVASSTGRAIRKTQGFCDLATPELEAQGYFGLVEYHSGTELRCAEAAQHASLFGGRFAVERIADKAAVVEFDNGLVVSSNL